ncbi:hypothetical protein [Rhodococcus sp. NPDC057529]|uniref:hypothetical protein n=1 Tax=Rhodococcus sp. NPDC057529 TaxID=3346158 RepID=UPI0036717842
MVGTGVAGRKPKPEGRRINRRALKHDWTDVPDVLLEGAPKLPLEATSGEELADHHAQVVKSRLDDAALPPLDGFGLAVYEGYRADRRGVPRRRREGIDQAALAREAARHDDRLPPRPAAALRRPQAFADATAKPGLASPAWTITAMSSAADTIEPPKTELLPGYSIDESSGAWRTISVAG